MQIEIVGQLNQHQSSAILILIYMSTEWALHDKGHWFDGHYCINSWMSLKLAPSFLKWIKGGHFLAVNICSCMYYIGGYTTKKYHGGQVFLKLQTCLLKT